MVGVDEELGADVRARPREPPRCGTIRPVSKSTAETSDGARALVDRRRHPLGQRLGRLGGQALDLEPLLGQPRELAAQRVELAVGRDEPRATAEIERREEAR